MQVTITKIFREEKVSQKTGKPYTSLQLFTKEHGEQRLSGFGNRDNQNWKIGDTVEIEVKEIERDGNTYLNFETPRQNGRGGGFTEDDRNMLKSIQMMLVDLKNRGSAPVDNDVF